MSQAISDMSVTWADGTLKNGIKLNVTDTSSNASSLLMDLGTGGGSFASRFKVDKAGNTTMAAGLTFTGTMAAIGAGGVQRFALNSSGVQQYSADVGPRWTSNWANDGTVDLFLFRDAANTLAQRNGANGQTFRLYGTYTDATIAFERFFIEAPSAAGAAVKLGTQKGTGASARALELQIDGVTRWTFAGNATTINRVSGGESFNIANELQFGAGGGISITWPFNPNIRWVGTLGGAADLVITRDAANVFAQRNGANAQESRIYGSYTSATNYQRMSVKTVREVTPALTSGATYVSTIAIPAYAHLIGVTTRVNTAITGATTYSVGDGTDADLWGASIPIAVDSESRTADFTAVAAVGPAATSRTVTLTANGSDFTAGVVEICLHYLTTEAD
jgi:hypothetical protein